MSEVLDSGCSGRGNENQHLARSNWMLLLWVGYWLNIVSIPVTTPMDGVVDELVVVPTSMAMIALVVALLFQQRYVTAVWLVLGAWIALFALSDLQVLVDSVFWLFNERWR